MDLDAALRRLLLIAHRNQTSIVMLKSLLTAGADIHSADDLGAPRLGSPP